LSEADRYTLERKRVPVYTASERISAAKAIFDAVGVHIKVESEVGTNLAAIMTEALSNKVDGFKPIDVEVEKVDSNDPNAA
jgi:hypothetical protein